MKKIFSLISIKDDKKGRTLEKGFNLLDLFSGCGGLSLGFHQAGFNIQVANDIWNIALETYKLNHPNTKTVLGNINDTNVQNNIIKECSDDIDIVVGGPPCQAYSLAGSRNPEDPRGKLFNSYVDIVKKIKPKMFVIENVKGILSMKHFMHDTPDYIKSKYMDIINERRSNKLKVSIEDLNNKINNYLVPVTTLIKNTFEQIGYDVQYKLLNSADYGVPQGRHRVFFIGTYLEKQIKFPNPTHSKAPTLSGREKYATLKDTIGDMPFPDINEEDELYEGGYSSIYMSRNRRKKWDEISFTIQAGQRHIPLHPASPPMSKVGADKWVFGEGLTRRLSVRECARVQTFPDSFTFTGKTVHKYRQIGNAVPPLLAKNVAESALQILQSSRLSSN